MLTPHTIQAEWLPESLKEIIRLIGVANALAMVQQRGGVPVRIPKHSFPEHWLAQTIGMEAMEKLVKYYADDTIELPRCVKALQNLKHQEIINYAEEHTTVDTARHYNYTRRGINKIKQRKKQQIKNDKQQDLFH